MTMTDHQLFLDACRFVRESLRRFGDEPDERDVISAAKKVAAYIRKVRELVDPKAA